MIHCFFRTVPLNSFARFKKKLETLIYMAECSPNQEIIDAVEALDRKAPDLKNVYSLFSKSLKASVEAEQTKLKEYGEQVECTHKLLQQFSELVSKLVPVKKQEKRVVIESDRNILLEEYRRKQYEDISGRQEEPGGRIIYTKNNTPTDAILSFFPPPPPLKTRKQDDHEDESKNNGEEKEIEKDQAQQSHGGSIPAKTDERVVVGNRKCVVYRGQRGARYVKQNGEFVSVKRAQAIAGSPRR